METITGYVDHIVFRNEDNGYTVFQLRYDERELTCVGIFHYIEEGELFTLKGEYSIHPTYGKQFKIKEYQLQEPEDLTAIERYLGSGAIKGVGAKTAANIVERFQEETFRIMEEEPERLAEIKGISPKKARDISRQVEEKKGMRQSMIFLQKYGISLKMAVKIYEKFGSHIYRVMEENPYRLADEIEGIGFQTADEIAIHAGIRLDSDFRIQSGIFYALQQSVYQGHVYLPKEELLRRAHELLGVEISHMEEHLQNLAMERRIVIKQKEDLQIYLANYYYMELNTAKMLHDLNIRRRVDEEAMQGRLKQIEKETGLVLNALQRQAVMQAIKGGVLLLTGGPGTGKTTTINTMIRLFQEEEMQICLAAPTGRAAKRMTEATGYEARTLHRVLEMNAKSVEEGSQGRFLRNEENPLEEEVIIVDEMSMVDLPLFYALLQAIRVGSVLVLVGDEDQLPSVGCGSVLKDMLQSHSFPFVMLTDIFRQAKESDIVVNAHRIQQGLPIQLDNRSQDFFFLKRQENEIILQVVITLLQKKLPPYVGVEAKEIQVLTPMRRGSLGVENLNRVLQRYLNPRGKEKTEKIVGDRLFRVGDKVMQIRNNYQLEWEIRTKFGLAVERGAGIFNGDMGVITKINPYQETIEVVFDENRTVLYETEQLEELEHAYAITIHKSQGSEYPAVILPLLGGPKQLLNRNLLYTAVTRAKRCVVLVGSESSFREMIQNSSEQKRYTGLRERMQELYEEAEKISGNALSGGMSFLSEDTKRGHLSGVQKKSQDHSGADL